MFLNRRKWPRTEVVSISLLGLGMTIVVWSNVFLNCRKWARTKILSLGSLGRTKPTTLSLSLLRKALLGALSPHISQAIIYFAFKGFDFLVYRRPNIHFAIKLL